MARKKKRSYRKTKKVSWDKALMGGVAVAVAEPFINQLAGSLGIGISDDIVKLGVGLWASKKSGFVGEGGKALAYISGARLLSGGLSGLNLGGLLSGGTTSTSSSGVEVI